MLAPIAILSGAGNSWQTVADCGTPRILHSPRAGSEWAICAKNMGFSLKPLAGTVLARHLHLLGDRRGLASPPHRTLKWGLRSPPAIRSSPLTRMAKTGCSCRVRGPTFFFSASSFCQSARVFGHRPLTGEGSVRYCAVFREVDFATCASLPPRQASVASIGRAPHS